METKTLEQVQEWRNDVQMFINELRGQSQNHRRTVLRLRGELLNQTADEMARIAELLAHHAKAHANTEALLKQQLELRDIIDEEIRKMITNS